MANENMQQMPEQSQMPGQPQMPPDYVEFFSGGVSELTNMLNDITKRDTLVAEVKSLVTEGKKLEKELNDEKKKLESDMNSSINNEREQYVAEENKIINEGNATLKKIRSDRNKAKEKGIKDRIENETSDMIEENKKTRKFIRNSLKENNMPRYCDSNWFYTLYCTQGIVEWMIKLLVFAVGLVIIPGIVVLAVHKWWFFEILIWVGIMFVFIAIYITIFLCTKDRDNGVLEDMREYREKMNDNRKKIKAVKKGIKTDTDESQYHLGEFDEKIAEAEKRVADATQLKEQKLKQFEESIKQQVIEKVNAKHVPVINEKESIVNEKADLYQKKNSELGLINQNIVQNYEKYLTKPYTNADSVKRMLELINNNNAADIGQAYALIKR